MGDSGEWTSLVDDRILEYLRNHGPGSPSEMMREGPIRYTPQHIARRCKVLALHGLVRHTGNGGYELTEQGEGYLRGEFGTSEDAKGESSEGGEGFVFGASEGDGEDGG